MNKKDLDILLNKFYNGETTLDEEELLRNALAGDDADATLMRALEKMEDEVEVPAELEASISDKIDEWEASEQHEEQAHRKAKVAPLFLKRPAWAAAASVAVIAAVGWWVTHNNSQQIPGDNNPPVIAKVEDKLNHVPDNQDITIQDENIQPEQQPPRQHKSQSPPHIRPASAYKNKVEHLAQANESVQGDEQLSESDEEIALAALEKFSTTLNKGMDQLNDAREKIEDINNTVQKNLI